MENPTCDGRTAGKPHCWHSFAPPVSSANNIVLFPSICCWCTPKWYHIEVFVPHSVPDTEVVTANFEHGPLVTINKAPARGPQIHIAR